MLPTLILVLVALVAPAWAFAGESGWRRPVPDAVARPFSYGADPFQAGWHRGADFAAARGTPVRSACSGVVATARPGLVTLRCGRWRVTHLPLASVSVAEGASVRAGRVIGTVGTSEEHTGLHLGVRRAGDRFAYVDPLPFLAGRPAPPPTAVPPRTTRIPRTVPARPPAPPPLGGSRVTARRAQPPASVPATPPVALPASPPAAARAAPPAAVRAVPPAGVRAVPPAGVRAVPPAALPALPRAAGVRVSPPAAARGLAPWPAWAGLGLLLAGAIGGGVRVRARRHRAGLSTPVPSAR